MNRIQAARDALFAAGYQVLIEHTGGGIHVVRLPLVSLDGDVIVSEDGDYAVGYYAGNGWIETREEDRIIWGLKTTDDVIAAVRDIGRDL